MCSAPSSSIKKRGEKKVMVHEIRTTKVSKVFDANEFLFNYAEHITGMAR